MRHHEHRDTDKATDESVIIAFNGRTNTELKSLDDNKPSNTTGVCWQRLTVNELQCWRTTWCFINMVTWQKPPSFQPDPWPPGLALLLADKWIVDIKYKYVCRNPFKVRRSAVREDLLSLQRIKGTILRFRLPSVVENTEIAGGHRHAVFSSFILKTLSEMSRFSFLLFALHIYRAQT